MTHDEAVFLRDHILSEIEREKPITMRLVDAIPADQLEHRPHPKGMTMRELVWHILQAETLLLECLANGGWRGITIDQTVPDTLDAMRAKDAAAWAPGMAKVRVIPAERLVEPLELFGAKDLLVRHIGYIPRHTLHHRGQLSTYLRAVGAFVPGALGWSADERERANAKD